MVVTILVLAHAASGHALVECHLAVYQIRKLVRLRPLARVVGLLIHIQTVRSQSRALFWFVLRDCLCIFNELVVPILWDYNSLLFLYLCCYWLTNMDKFSDAVCNSSQRTHFSVWSKNCVATSYAQSMEPIHTLAQLGQIRLMLGGLLMRLIDSSQELEIFF